MSKICKYDTGFTQVLNEVLYDKNLSLKAKGVYAYLFSKPDGWQFHNECMSKDLKESREVVASAINELVSAGYIIKERYRENGILGGNVYTFINPTCAANHLCGKIPHRENHAYNNTDISSNTNINNINSVPENGFDEWYSVYPRKISKANAKKSYSSALKKVSGDILLGAVKVFAQDILKKGTEERFIPHPSTWLNQERWEDYKPKAETKANNIPMGVRLVNGMWVDLYTNRTLFSAELNPNPDWTKFNTETRSF